MLLERETLSQRAWHTTTCVLIRFRKSASPPIALPRGLRPKQGRCRQLTAGNCTRFLMALLFTEAEQLVRFVIAAEINPNKPSAVSSCDFLANSASHRVSSLAPKRGTELTHYRGIKTWIT